MWLFVPSPSSTFVQAWAASASAFVSTEPDSRCIAYVEREAYAASCLVARMESRDLDLAPVWSDLATFDAGAWRGAVDCVVSGDPCQPNSCAGRGAGADDDRWLIERVVEVFDQCGAVRLFRENVTGNTEGQLAALVPLLEGLGCSVAAGIFAASSVGASHQRERLFIMADRQKRPADERRPVDDSLRGRCRQGQEGALRAGRHWPDDAGRSEVADADGARGASGEPDQARGQEGVAGVPVDSRGQLFTFAPRPSSASWPDLLEAFPVLEPAIRRVADGPAHRVERLRACGGACVPLAAAYAWTALDALLASGRSAAPAVVKVAA